MQVLLFCSSVHKLLPAGVGGHLGEDESGQKFWRLFYIRKEKYRPATPTAAALSRSGYPPWILKGGVEWRALAKD